MRIPHTTVDNNPGNADTSAAPVETNAPNSNYKPAFAGQTRTVSVKTATPYAGKVLSNGLKSPWGIAPLPDGRLLTLEELAQARDAELSRLGEVAVAWSALAATP